MNIDDELNDILNDPLLNLSEKEKSLFDIPADMKKVESKREKAEYVAQRRICENFGDYQEGFKNIHK